MQDFGANQNQKVVSVLKFYLSTLIVVDIEQREYFANIYSYIELLASLHHLVGKIYVVEAKVAIMIFFNIIQNSTGQNNSNIFTNSFVLRSVARTSF